MPTLTASEEIVVLGNAGVSVTREAVTLLWSLENRGLIVELDDGDLLVGPRGQLTGTDRQGIRAHKDELISLVRVCGEVVA